MPSVEDKLKEMGLTLPVSPAPVANYVPSVRTGNLLYLSGVGPAKRPDGTTPTGKLGQDMTVEEGYEAAKLCGLNLLANMKAALGDFRKVKRVVKLLTMVNSAPDFTEQPAVANGCSDLLVELFGERGRHARAAVGMGSLPMGIAVEIEMIVELED